MKNVRRNIGAQALMAFVVIIGLYFGYSFAREVVQAERLTSQEAVATALNDQIAAENSKLARDKAYYESDAYVQESARTNLNMRMPGDLIILPIIPDQPTPDVASAAATTTPDAAIASLNPSDTSATAATSSADTSNTPNWDRWLSLFQN